MPLPWNCENASSGLLKRERLEPAGAITHLDTPRRLAVLAPAFPPRSPTSPSRSPALPRRSHSKMASPLRPRTPLPRKSAWMSASWRKSARRKVNTWPPRSRAKAAPPPRFWPRLFPKKSPRSTGRRTCTGASAEKCSSARCAGWSRCWMSRSCRWSCSASPPARLRADTGSSAARPVTIVEAQRLRRSLARRESARRRRARAGHPQSTGCGDAHHPRRPLAGRQAAAGDRRESDGVSLRHSRQLRSGVSRTARGSAGHGDARSPEIFCDRRRKRETSAALSGRAQHGRRFRRIDPPRQRARAARPLQ